MTPRPPRPGRSGTSPLRGEEAKNEFVRRMHELGVDVSRETLAQLEVLIETLGHWQRAINLVGRGTMAEIWTRHVLDSAQIAPLVPKEARTLADLGSGGGFPGLVIAALRPDLEMTLIETDARKTAFLGEAARRMGLSRLPTILVDRIEAAPPIRADVLTARALAPLDRLLVWAARHRKDTAICLFHKGKGWQGELTESMKAWDISVQPLASVTDRDAVILRIGQYAAKHTSTGVRHRQPKGRRGQDDHRD